MLFPQTAECPICVRRRRSPKLHRNRQNPPGRQSPRATPMRERDPSMATPKAARRRRCLELRLRRLQTEAILGASAADGVDAVAGDVGAAAIADSNGAANAQSVLLSLDSRVLWMPHLRGLPGRPPDIHRFCCP